MSFIFEELDYQQTPLGEISLRRRSEPKLAGEVLYEVKLGEEFLMSSLFVEAEEQLSTLGLQALKRNGHERNLAIIVGGLGLGYTALQVLKECTEPDALQSLRVIDVMQAVISWHQRGLLPIGDVLATDPRSQLQQGDFFAIATAPGQGFAQDSLGQDLLAQQSLESASSIQNPSVANPSVQRPTQKVHAVLLDIDHSPSHWLNQSNSDFYTVASLRQMAQKIHSGGVFGLWSNELPDPVFIDLLNQVFINTSSQVVKFTNPYQDIEATNSVYIATVK